MELGKSIRKIREYKNLTQEYVASEIGVSRKWYSQLENDGQEIKQERLEKIAKVLDVSIEDIVNFNSKQFLQSTFKDNSTNNGVVFSIKEDNFEQQKSLYEKLLNEKDLRINVLEKLIESIENK
jgi:transcriptional regulator with XRE-family HTH domain